MAHHAGEVSRANDEIPRRPAARPGSLLDVDACTLLTPADLRALPGFAAATPATGFANRECRWANDEGSAAARGIFDRGNAESAMEGEHSPRAGHDVYLLEEGYGELLLGGRAEPRVPRLLGCPARGDGTGGRGGRPADAGALPDGGDPGGSGRVPPALIMTG